MSGTRSRGWLIGAAALIAVVIAFYLHSAGRIRPGLLSNSSAGIGDSTTFRVRAILMPQETQVIGSIESRAPVEVSSNISARVRAIHVRAGQHITRGEILVQLDSTSLVADLARARAARSAALAELTRTQADWHRYSALYSRGSATAQERDAARAAYSSAAANEQQAAAAISGANSALAYATVRSPVDGIVVDRMVEPGDMAMPGKPLLRIYGNRDMRVALAVPEGLLGSLRLGAPIRISVGAVHRDFAATISEIVPAANAQSGSVAVRADLPNDAGLQPGMFARAEIPGTSEALLAIPRSAVQAVGQLNTVRVLSNGSVELRQVALGRPLGAQVEVLAGLSAGETVLLEAAPNPSHVVHQ